MDNPNKRDKSEIFEELTRLSRFFTPVWTAEENGAGRALAELFSQLLSENYGGLPEMIERHRLMLLNMYGLSKKPAFPARGYITVTPTADNIITLKSGTRIGSTADAEFVTESDLCAVNIKIVAVFSTKSGVICRGSIDRLFDYSGENTEEAALYFSSEDILSSEGKCVCQVALLDISAADQHGKAPKATVDPGTLRWQYLTSGSAENITDVRCEDGVFTLNILDGVPITTRFDISGKWLKLVFSDGNMPKAISRDSVRLCAELSGIAPKSVYLNENMLPASGFLPFGEEPVEYDAFYVCGTEVLSKKGSRVTVVMELTFGEYAVNSSEENSVQWKTVMPVSKFEPKPPLKKRIEGSVWEYWNGMGWCRIYPDDTHTNDFADVSAGSLTIEFCCPADIEPVYVGADFGLFIRCRITRVTPGYAQDMICLMPRCEEITLGCSYDGQFLRADNVFVSKNMRVLDAGGETVRLPLSENSSDSFTYICLDHGIPVGYYNMYIRVKNALVKQHIRWEALCTVRGEQRWQPLAARDRTAGLSESGMVTLRIEFPMCRKTIYGEEGFWLRIGAPSPAVSVETNGISLNVSPVLQHSKAVSMSFTTAARDDVYQLSSGDIYTAELFLCENGGEELIPPKNYTLDSEKGIISFNRGYKPQLSDGKTLTVRFTTTAGAGGNLPAGELNSFLDPVPFVDTIGNPEPTFGGRNTESFSACSARGKDKVRTLERCVTESDFEAAARSADPAIARAKCQSGSGEIRLTLLTDKSDIPIFRLARQNVLDAILPAMPFYLQSRLEINRAAYVKLDVTAYVVSDGKAFPQTIQSDIRTRLRAFLDPVSGNTAETGYDIGEYPDPESVAAVISTAEHIIAVNRIQLVGRYGADMYDYEQLASFIEDGVPDCGDIVIYITEQNEL